MLTLELGLPPKQLWKVRLPHHLVALLVFQGNPKHFHPLYPLQWKLKQYHLQSRLPHQLILKLSTNVLKPRGLPQKKLLLQRGV